LLWEIFEDGSVRFEEDLEDVPVVNMRITITADTLYFFDQEVKAIYVYIGDDEIHLFQQEKGFYNDIYVENKGIITTIECYKDDKRLTEYRIKTDMIEVDYE